MTTRMTATISLMVAICLAACLGPNPSRKVGSYISGPITGTNPAVLNSTNTSTTVSAANSTLNFQTSQASGLEFLCGQNTNTSALSCLSFDSISGVNLYYNNSTSNGISFYDTSGGGAGVAKGSFANNYLNLIGNSTFATTGSLTLRPATSGAITMYLSGGLFLPTWAPYQTTGSPSVVGTTYTKCGTLRTVNSSTATTIVTIDSTAGFLNNSNALIETSIACRAVTAPTAGAIGDGWMARRSIGARNVSNVAAAIGTIASVETHTDTSMSATAATITASGATMLLQLANVASATIDCTACTYVTND